MRAPDTGAHQWGVILAGGEGVRLRSLTRLISGDDRPKQFCPITRGRSLLAQTRLRIAPLIPQDRTLLVLLKSHEDFYTTELSNVAPRQMAVQPRNRGTLPAILFSLARILRQDRAAQVAFFPSDHHYLDERGFLAGVESAFSAASTDPHSVILLGVPASHPETGYGWIEAEGGFEPGSSEVRKLRRFWEKPSAEVAHDLMERGCVWNTFVMIGRAAALWDTIQCCAADQARAFDPLLRSDDSDAAEAELRRIYDSVPAADFSSLVLAHAAERLRVLCLSDVGWSDLGEPQRVMAVLSAGGGREYDRFAAAAAGLGV